MNYRQEAKKLGYGTSCEILDDGRYALVSKRGGNMTIYLFDKVKDAMQIMYNSPSVKDYVFDLEKGEKV